MPEPKNTGSSHALGGAAWIGAATGELLEGPGFQPIPCNGTCGATRVVDVSDFELATLHVATGRTTVYSTTSGSSALVRTASVVNGPAAASGSGAALPTSCKLPSRVSSTRSRYPFR